MGKNLLLTLTLIAAFLVNGCGSQTPIPSPLVGEVVTVDSPETRDLSPTTETVPNCSGSNSIIIKHPSMTVLTTHSIEWEVAGQVGVGVIIGEGVIPGGVNLSGTFESSLSQSSQSGMQQGTVWDLPAEPNTIMEYTLMWREIWQHGYVDVNLADGRKIRVNVTYRTGIQSDIVGTRKSGCPNGPAVSTQASTIIPTQNPAIQLTSDSENILPPDQQSINTNKNLGNWLIIVGGGYTSILQAQSDLHKTFPSYTNVAIFFRNSDIRTAIIGFSTEVDAKSKLKKVKLIRSTAYLVKLSEWCPLQDNYSDHIECK